MLIPAMVVEYHVLFLETLGSHFSGVMSTGDVRHR
jgi:hypothetical protein